MGEGVLCVLSSLEVHKKPPNTSQQVLVAVKSEDRAPRSDGRVCKGLWNPTKDRVGVWKPQSCRLQGPSLTVSIGPQEKFHSFKVNLQSDGEKALD